MNRCSHKSIPLPAAALLSACLAIPQAFAAASHEAYVYAWDSSAAWTVFVDHAQEAPYSGFSSATYNGSTWTCTWDIDAAAGTVRSVQLADHPAGATGRTVCQSSMTLTDVFHFDAGTSGLSSGTPITANLSGSFVGWTLIEADLYQDGTVNVVLNVENISTHTTPFTRSLSQNCYTDGSPGYLYYDIPFDITLNTTVGASLMLSMSIDPTQTAACAGDNHDAGFDLTGTWAIGSTVPGLDIHTDGGLVIPEPSTLLFAAAAIPGLLIALRRRMRRR